MKLGRCHVCHSTLHLDALVQDEAARELLALLTPLDGGLARALVSYMGLFRPEKSDLSWKRALKLATEALALTSNRDWLRAALEDTVQKLREARQTGQRRSLTNHNYLKKVLQGISDGAVIVAPQPVQGKAKPSLEIKSYSRPESLAESQARHQKFLDGFRKDKQ
ncbi:hypothetical protein [Shewanella sp. Isolate7]|uniref:hypothetical protein n=1 Tax=Shewanella sp. Isolate7 TaxID=2908528 RepID=UPI001EFD4E9C|nr:hypothetical protein [Shewanella sp. Isolate7]MCG9722132.1 hypothetical protein [Shewanella sp. Isolate7]